MAGDNAAFRARFGQFTARLRQGELPVPAFTNALQTPLPVVEAELRRYLARGVFAPIDLALSADVDSPITVAARYLTPVEIYFRLGDELLRINRLDAAELRFKQAKRLAPSSPLPEEGLGLLAHESEQHEAALRAMNAAIQRGSTSFLAYYISALEAYRATADGDKYAPLEKNQAAEIRARLARAVALMPDFGPAQELAGFFEMVQGEHLVAAGNYLQRAIQLEPENPSYLLSLAQFQYRTQSLDAARQTLEPLMHPNVDAKLRAAAAELKQELDRHNPAN
jgi:tetratricopeptide (TPR) repeat protein